MPAGESGRMGLSDNFGGTEEPRGNPSWEYDQGVTSIQPDNKSKMTLVSRSLL